MPKQKLNPLPSAAFQILLALVDEDLHGYGIMRQVEEQTEGRMRLGPGTLYSSIRTLLEADRAFEQYIRAVESGAYPGKEHGYQMIEEEKKKFAGHD